MTEPKPITFEVVLDVAQYDDETGDSHHLDVPGVALATFDSFEQAEAFARIVGELAKHIVGGEVYIPAVLADRRQVAVIWSVEDVLGIRPDLTEAQAWEVLQQACDTYDSEFGLNWESLGTVADDLYGLPSKTCDTPS